MQKHIIIVLSSFFGVALIIMLGTNIAYRTNVIPSLKNDFAQERSQKEQLIGDKDKRIEQLKNELTIAYERQQEAEKKLQEKLDEEERIARQKAQAIEDARIAAQIQDAANAKAAAEKARKAAEKKASKKSKAS